MSVDRNEDTALVARIARGDRSAVEQLYRRHALWLTKRLTSRCGDPDLVDIAVQDTFVAVWKSAKKYRGDGDVGAWIWGIAVRRLIDQMRKRRPLPMESAFLQTRAGTPVSSDAASSSIVSFEDELLGNGSHGALGPAIRQLHPDLRAVLILTAVDGLTTKEAATVLGIPQGTVKTRLQRARATTKEILS